MKAVGAGVALLAAGLLGLTRVDPRAENLFAVAAPAAIVAAYVLIGWGLAGGADDEEEEKAEGS